MQFLCTLPDFIICETGLGLEYFHVQNGAVKVEYVLTQNPSRVVVLLQIPCLC